MPLRRLVLLAPIVFLLHVLEEAPGFVAWFNWLVPRGITPGSFLMANAVAFAVTLGVVILFWNSPQPAVGMVLAVWVGFLMLANGMLHLVATLVHRRYSPGLVTGTVLYLPYGVLLLERLVRDLGLRRAAVAGAAALGGVPMLVHGYLIVFRASRLF